MRKVRGCWRRRRVRGAAAVSDLTRSRKVRDRLTETRSVFAFGDIHLTAAIRIEWNGIHAILAIPLLPQVSVDIADA